MSDPTSPQATTTQRLLEAADRFAAEGRMGMAELARQAALQPPAHPVSAPAPSWPAVRARPRPDDADER